MDLNSNQVPDLPIPAGEIGVQLETNILLHNLNDKDINDFQMYLFFPKHFDWSNIPTGCDK